MTFGNSIYLLLIKPLYLLFEVIFSIANRFTGNPGVSIIFLSLAVNLLVFPLYRRADAMQVEERNLENKLKPRVDQIKKTFSGDERFMMLQTFYRQNNYKPTYALKGSLSLLLEIPFFIAAYGFLSGLQLLKGVSFGPIRNLGVPDAMITLQGVSINILPVLMTLINIISAAIYLKGAPLKSKLQTYGMAMIFLVFLYDSPSGLVFYWTLNNLFSLIKNIFYKLNNPKKALAIVMAFIGIAGLILVIGFQPFDSMKKRLFVCGVCVMLILPLLFGMFVKRKVFPAIPAADKMDNRIFLTGSVFMTILAGVLIPSNVVKTSPGEFINLEMFYSPLWYVLSALLIAAGTFLIWFGIYYRLASFSVKKVMALFMLIISAVSSVNYMFFGTNRGNMSADLVYDNVPEDTMRDCFINIVVLLAVSVLVFLVWKRKNKIAYAIISSMALASFVMSAGNIVELNKDLTAIKEIIRNRDPEDKPHITLSKQGKNVMILMMDRSIGYFMPFLLEENPEFRQQFSGFTYYPQTISFASQTIEGLPGIYGGYEYIPENTDKRSDLKLVEKHNEALLMMPSLFGKAGYEVTVLNPTYANFKVPSDLSIYQNHDNVKAYNLNGIFASPQGQKIIRETRSRNFFCYSIYKISPLVLQPTLYTYGLYNEADAIALTRIGYTQTIHSLLKAAGTREDFEEQYLLLKNLNTITEIKNDSLNTFTTLDNTATHDFTMLQMPDYTPAPYVDNTSYEKIPVIRKSINGDVQTFETPFQIMHYQINMAAYLMLGKWFDFLKENDVYDNTRIIIVADHGEGIGFRNFVFGDSGWEDILFFNPILMVKDFNSQNFSIDEQFMTNADVPSLAMQDIIESPVNPATGNPVTNDLKDTLKIRVEKVAEWNPKYNNGYTFIPGNRAVFHGGNIYDPTNWDVTEINIQ